MTKEEAIKKINAIKKYLTAGNPIWDVREIDEVLNMAIKALEQEPVKHGEWKYYNFSDINNPYVGWYECTVCKHHEYSEREYCPNCGADMRGESHDKRRSD